MGSEHYCLRWNNHQSNLLGVFSQLLQDESLVDVTLACSEGASIRAHKVVLSACSSYFQTLFLDHPARHPIVILKDVRFSELRTLIEFMYKGEVNVEYCQLSALLKTAESLKVKGLAEMTNQSSSVVRDSDRDTERLRAHLHGTSSSTSSSHTVTSGSALPTAIGITAKSFESLAETKNRSLESDTCSPSPTRLPPSPIALYQRKNREHHTHSSSVSSLNELANSNNNNNNNNNINNSVNSSSNNINNNNEDCNEDCNMNTDERHSNEDDNDVKMKNEMGLNMTISPTVINSSSLITDLRPSSRGERNSPRSQRDRNERSSTSGIPSPLSNDPMPGPSGIGPVQQVPLSLLKKEIDWDRVEDRSSGDSSLDFRHPHDSDTSEPHGGLGGSSACGTIGVLGPSHLIDQGGPMYPCMYCGASFPHQSKLTRHILSHSLETLKYRETAHLLHPGHLALLQQQQQHELSQQQSQQQHNQQTNIVQSPSQSQLSSPHFPHRTGSLLEPLEPPDGSSPMDMDFAAVSAAVSAVSGNAVTSDQGSVVLCKFCGKSFPDVSSLITHLPVHTGDRPFKCEFCGKAFKLRHHMKDHCRVHTGERPFRCGMCGKTFSRSTILKAHEKTHYPKYVRKFLSPSPVDTKDESPQ